MLGANDAANPIACTVAGEQRVADLMLRGSLSPSLTPLVNPGDMPTAAVSLPLPSPIRPWNHNTDGSRCGSTLVSLLIDKRVQQTLCACDAGALDDEDGRRKVLIRWLPISHAARAAGSSRR